MPWLHIPMLMTSAPIIFHFIAQRLLSMEPGSDASPTNTGDGRAGISRLVAFLRGKAIGWAQRVIGGFWGSSAVTLSSLGPLARWSVEPPRLESRIGNPGASLPCSLARSTGTVSATRLNRLEHSKVIFCKWVTAPVG